MVRGTERFECCCYTLRRQRRQWMGSGTLCNVIISGGKEFVGKKRSIQAYKHRKGNQEAIRTDIVLLVALIRNMSAHIKGEA